MFEYIVQPGDYLYRIADYFDISVQAILAANPGLNPNNLYVGQRIRIPISRNLYQMYPWYYLYPYMFIRFPRRHWDDRRWWPPTWRGRGAIDGRRRRNDRDGRDDRDRRQGGDGWSDNDYWQDVYDTNEWDDMDEWNDIPSATMSFPQQNTSANLATTPEVNMELGTFETPTAGR